MGEIECSVKVMSEAACMKERLWKSRPYYFVLVVVAVGTVKRDDVRCFGRVWIVSVEETKNETYCSVKGVE